MDVEFDRMTVARAIKPPDAIARKACVERFDRVAKPVGSLGDLEELVAKIAAATGTADVDISKKAVVVFCADNGVVARGVANGDHSVTTAIASMFAAGKASVSVMAKKCGAIATYYDVGMTDTVEGLIEKKLMRGTDDIASGSAMSRRTAERAIMIGIDAVKRLVAEQGVKIVAVAETGIGNTAVASALVSSLLALEPSNIVGRGAGIDDDGLERKLAAVRRAIKINSVDADDPIDALCKLGGLDIAAMAGAFLGAAICAIPAVIDGFISGAAALVAARICAGAKPYMLPSHASAEPGSRYVLDALGMSAVIDAGMRLGEGTGAVALFSLLDLALEVYWNAATFEDINVFLYRRTM